MDIVDALETVGIDRYDYRLQDAANGQAIKSVLNIAGENIEVSFVVEDGDVTLDSEQVTVTNPR